MAGRKHHYIQRLLLRGFSFNESQSPCHVWVYRKDGKIFSPALEGYGAERDFYGSPENGELDGEITAIESDRFNDFLHSARDGNDRDIDPIEATAFAVHVFFRSKNLRSVLTAGLGPLMKRTQARLGDPQILEQLLSSAIRQKSEQTLKELENAGGLRSHMVSSWKFAHENSHLYARQFIATRGPQLKQLLDNLQNRVSDFVAAGHRKALAERLRDFSGTRIEQLQGLHWRAMTIDGPLILGDSVILAELADGSFKSLSEPGDDLAYVWLPVRHDRVLVGSQAGKALNAEKERLNEGAARCSFDAFCSVVGPNAHASLIPLIRTGTFALSEFEADQIADECLARAIANTR